MSSAVGEASAAVSCSSASSSVEPPPSVERKEQEREEERADPEEQREASSCGSDEEVAVAVAAAGEEEEEEDDEEEDEDGKVAEAIDLGPRVSIKEQLEMDKEDESLRRWKEQLLGSVDLSSVGDTLEPDVRITSLCIVSPGRPDVSLPLPVDPDNSKGPWFTLKEGSTYRLKFTLSVSNNIVSGLRYTNTVWKAGIRVDKTKEMLGTFSPQLEPYTYLTPEETTPSGVFARGSYSAKTKFVDDDRKCYLEINYTFDIRRDWPCTS
uniref:Rho GDP-dissociation inhibitor 1 n=1 Tax=Leersia perrieri TaxID=77586 RepID=A0A0D9WPS5_9ORYZ